MNQTLCWRKMKKKAKMKHMISCLQNIIANIKYFRLNFAVLLESKRVKKWILHVKELLNLSILNPYSSAQLLQSILG